MGKLVVIKLGKGDGAGNLPVTVQIGEEGAPASAEILGQLPADAEIVKYYTDWQTPYLRLQRKDSRLGSPKGKTTNFSEREISDLLEACRKASQELRPGINKWLNSEEFRPGKEKLLENLDRAEEIRVIIQGGEDRHRRLPWHLWDLFESYTKAEVALSLPEFEWTGARLPAKEKVRILAILGNSKGIKVQEDREFLERIPGAEIEFLVEPQRGEISDKLWEREWDILFFAGHSSSQDGTGKIFINATDYLTVEDVRHGMRKAIERGLRLAIFNSCDGLKLAEDLADLHIPVTVVMREPVPDGVAQQFLRHFLKAFAGGKSLYIAVREARKRLHDQGLEDKIPGVSWLPAIFQNPAVLPPSWVELGGSLWAELAEIPPCPYRGLFAFREEDSEFFFGREGFTEKLGPAVRQKQLVAVIGASGCGKSSVVFAGLIPSLRRKGNWLIAGFRPQNSPFENLAEALLRGDGESPPARTPDEINRLAAQLKQTAGALQEVVERMVRDAGGNKRLLLVADQFEELYTLTPEADRQPFLDCLLKAVNDAAGFTLVLTLRADFYGYALSYRPFADALQDAGLNLGPMNENELENAISRPAEKRGVQLEEGLAQRLMDDVTERPGYLPLLQFTLTQLWAKQSGGKLTGEAYEKSGGVEESLGNFAEAEYGKLGEGDRKRAQRVFIQLVQPGEGTEDTRRLAKKAEVGEDNWDLVAQLASARLVVTNRNEATGEETVEIVHESLIRGWGRLQNWMRGHRAFRSWQERLRVAMRQWESTGSDEGALLRGAPLAEAEGWLQQRLDEITPAERVYIEMGLELREREQKERERQRRRTIAGLAGGLVAVSIFAAGAVWQWQRAERQRLISEADSLSNLALSQFQSGEGGISALKIALEAGQKLKQLVKEGEPLANYPTTRPLLALQTITGNIREKNEFLSENDGISKVIYTPDGKQIVSLLGQEGKVISWDLSGQRVAEWDDPDRKQIIDLAISPNGKYLVTVNEDSGLYIWDFSGKQIAKGTPRVIPFGNKMVKFSSDSLYVAVTGTFSSKVIFFDLSGQQTRELVTTNSGGTIESLELTANGETLVTGNSVGTVEFWNLNTGQKIREFKANTNQVVKIVLSPNEQQVLTLGVDINSSLAAVVIPRLWDLSGKKIADFSSFPPVATGVYGDVSFSPDGQQIATVIPGEGALKLYETKAGQLTEKVTISSLLGFSLSYSPDGKTLAISGVKGIKFFENNKSIFTELPINYEAERFLGINVEPIYRVKDPILLDLQYSADGQNLLATYFLPNVSSGNLDIWNWRKNTIIKRFNYGNNNIVNIAPDGKSALIVTKESVQKIDFAGHLISEVKTKVSEGENVLHAFNQLSNESYRVPRNYSSSFDGSKIVTKGLNFDKLGNPLRLWDLSTKQVKQLKNDYLPGTLERVVISPDGKYVLTISGGLGILWDASGNLIAGLPDVKAKPSAGREVTRIAILLSSFKKERTFFDRSRNVYYYSGIEILEVWQNSTALKAGLKTGDIILEIDGHKVSDMKDESEVYGLLDGQSGTPVKIKVKTDKEFFTDRIEEKTIRREKFVIDTSQWIRGNTVKFSYDSQYLATWAQGEKEVYIRYLKDNTVTKFESSEKIIDVYFSPDSKFIAVGCTDYTIKILNLSAKQISEIKLQEIGNLAFSPDSQQIGFLGLSHELSVWNLAGKQIARYAVPERGQGRIVFSPDGQYIATGGRKVMIWRNHNFNELLATGCDWLQDYLATRPQEKQKLQVCLGDSKSK